MSKIIKKILFNQMYQYVNKNKINRKHYNTSICLAQVIDDIIAAYDKKSATVLVCLIYRRHLILLIITPFVPKNLIF